MLVPQWFYSALNLLLFVFSLLALLAARRSAPAFRVWLMPLTIGWGIYSLTSIISAVCVHFELGKFYPDKRWDEYRTIISVDQAITFLGTACLIWGVVALYRQLQTLPFAPAADAQTRA